MAKRITYRATFSDGTEATRQSHRTYHYAWLAVVPYRERDRETGEYVEPFLWWRHSGFSNTYEGAEAEIRARIPRHRRRKAHYLPASKRMVAETDARIQAYAEQGRSEIVRVEIVP